MLGKNVVVFGGTGFVGRSVVNELSKQGYHTRLVVRRAERHRDFMLFPNASLVEQKELDAEILNDILKDTDLVVNLYADTTAKTENVTLDELVERAQKIKQAVEHAKITRLMILSQLGADNSQETNKYSCALAKADAIQLSTVNANVTIAKPGMLIGEGDETTSIFRTQLSIIGVLPVPNSSTVVQPLAVQDFALAFVNAIEDETAFAKKLNFVGEETLKLKELAQLIVEMRGAKPGWVIPMCGLGGRFMAYLGRLAPVKSVSATLVNTLKLDLISNDGFATLYGFEPTSLEQVLAKYIVEPGMRSRYNFYRKEAGRDEIDLA